MEIEFDPAKDLVNRRKHGVSLAFGKRVFDDPNHVIVSTIREEDSEERYRATGVVESKLWTAVHVAREDVIRLVSVRRSNAGEERRYAARRYSATSRSE